MVASPALVVGMQDNEYTDAQVGDAGGLFKSNITTPNIIMVDEATKRTLAAIPLLRTRAGPRDGDQWVTRLKEEYTSLIKVE